MFKHPLQIFIFYIKFVMNEFLVQPVGSTLQFHLFLSQFRSADSGANWYGLKEGLGSSGKSAALYVG